jgi:hypothetical protein
MADIVLAIKRSQTANTPTSLANGELAYSFRSNKLYIGQTDSAESSVTVEYIGGKLLVDKVANLESIVFGGGVSQNTITVTQIATINSLILSTATENSVLFAKGGGIIDFITGSTGKILQIAANGTPVFDDLNGGTY